MLWPTPSPKNETINIESNFFCIAQYTVAFKSENRELKRKKERNFLVRPEQKNIFFCSANRKECVRKKGRRDLSFVRTSFSNTFSSLLLFIFFLFNKSHFALFFFLLFFLLQQLSIWNRTLYYFLSLFTCLFLFSHILFLYLILAIVFC